MWLLRIQPEDYWSWYSRSVLVMWNYFSKNHSGFPCSSRRWEASWSMQSVLLCCWLWAAHWTAVFQSLGGWAALRFVFYSQWLESVVFHSFWNTFCRYHLDCVVCVCSSAAFWKLLPSCISAGFQVFKLSTLQFLLSRAWGRPEKKGRQKCAADSIQLIRPVLDGLFPICSSDVDSDDIVE